MYGHFATAAYGFVRDSGWAIWLGKITSNFHLHLRHRRAPVRSYVEGRVSVWRFAVGLTVMVYRPGASLEWHRDAPEGTRHRAIIWTVKKAHEGGQFQWRGEGPRHLLTSRILLIDGVATEHRVTEVKSGNRWVAMLQCAFMRPR